MYAAELSVAVAADGSTYMLLSVLTCSKRKTVSIHGWGRVSCMELKADQTAGHACNRPACHRITHCGRTFVAYRAPSDASASVPPDQ